MKISQFIFISFCFAFLIGCQSKPGQNKENNQENTTEMKTDDPQSSSKSQPGVSFHEAALSGNLKAVSAHIENSENVDPTNAEGNTPLMLASFNGHTEVVKKLLESGANINASNNKNLNPLHFAASGSFPKTVELLLKNGADVNATDDIENFTPLMYAASEGNTEVVKILVKHNADISMVDVDGDNAETFARQNNHNQIVEILQNP